MMGSNKDIEGTKNLQSEGNANLNNCSCSSNTENDLVANTGHLVSSTSPLRDSIDRSEPYGYGIQRCNETELVIKHNDLSAAIVIDSSNVVDGNDVNDTFGVIDGNNVNQDCTEKCAIINDHSEKDSTGFNDSIDRQAGKSILTNNCKDKSDSDYFGEPRTNSNNPVFRGDVRDNVNIIEDCVDDQAVTFTSGSVYNDNKIENVAPISGGNNHTIINDDAFILISDDDDVDDADVHGPTCTAVLLMNNTEKHHSLNNECRNNSVIYDGSVSPVLNIENSVVVNCNVDRDYNISEQGNNKNTANVDISSSSSSSSNVNEAAPRNNAVIRNCDYTVDNISSNNDIQNNNNKVVQDVPVVTGKDFVADNRRICIDDVNSTTTGGELNKPANMFSYRNPVLCPGFEDDCIITTTTDDKVETISIHSDDETDEENEGIKQRCVYPIRPGLLNFSAASFFNGGHQEGWHESNNDQNNGTSVNGGPVRENINYLSIKNSNTHHSIAVAGRKNYKRNKSKNRKCVRISDDRLLAGLNRISKSRNSNNQSSDSNSGSGNSNSNDSGFVWSGLLSVKQNHSKIQTSSNRLNDENNDCIEIISTGTITKRPHNEDRNNSNKRFKYVDNAFKNCGRNIVRNFVKSKRNIIIDGHDVALSPGEQTYNMEGVLRCVKFFLQRTEGIVIVVFCCSKVSELIKCCPRDVFKFMTMESLLKFIPDLVSSGSDVLLNLVSRFKALFVTNGSYDHVDKYPYNCVLRDRMLSYQFIRGSFVPNYRPHSHNSLTFHELMNTY